MKKSLFFLLPLALFANNLGNLNANSLNKNNVSSKHKKPEQGWRFGDNPEVNSSKKDDKKTIKQILAEMLKVQKEQLKVQKKMLAILQDQFDPKPKMITLPNGKKCLENSSAECFRMPLTPTAKRIPALKNWLLHRDIKSAANYIKWQSKYIKEITKGAYAYDFAVTEYGNKVAQVNYSQPGFEETFGATSVIRHHYTDMLLSQYKDKFKVYIFLGESPDLDVYSFTIIGRFVRAHPDLHYVVIFKNQHEKKAFFDAGKIFFSIRDMLKNKNVTFKVSPESFKKLNIYTTPTVSIKLNNSNTLNKVLVGRFNSVLKTKILNYLRYKNVIKDGTHPTYKAWEKAGNFSKEYYDQYYDVNISKILNTYKGK